MIITFEQLKGIATTGGGLVINASDYSIPQLAQLCRASAAGNGRLTFRQVGALTGLQLAELAAQAPGLLSIDLTD